jgi:hypothetical protein
LARCVGGSGVGYEPEGGLDVEPDDGAVPEPAGGVPVWVPEPLPMLGQFWVEPEPALPELELPVLELDDGAVVDELLVEPPPELPVVVDVVAALATNAPPATRPEVSALVASTLRRRIFIGLCPFISCGASAHPGRHHTRCTPDLGATAQWGRRARGVV